MKYRTLPLLLLAVLGLIWPAFATPGQKRSGAAEAAPIVKPVDLDGLKKVLSRSPSSRPLLVNFWATWCDGCREEFPDLVKIDQDYRSRGLDFVTISLDDLADMKTAVPAFLHQVNATMPVYLLNVSDPEPAIRYVDGDWGGALPATFLYDPQGKVVFKHFGAIKPPELRAAIDKVIGAQ